MAIQDLVGNALQPGATGQVLGYREPTAAEEVLPLRMYDFLEMPIRTEDLNQGALFVKRLLEGPQELWRQTQERIFAIKDLWDITKIEDRHLKYLKHIVGWTPDTDKVTKELDDVTLRKLIAASIPLWAKRGPEDSIINVLSLTTGARLRIWNWFDYRWLTDETEIGEEHEGRDPWCVELPGLPDSTEYWSNIRIVDDGTLNRALVVELVKLMRAISERFLISYITFLDLFIIDGDTVQWEIASGTLPSVGEGVATMIDDASLQITYAGHTNAPTWSDYVSYWRVKGTSAADGNDFGAVVYCQTNGDCYLVTLDTAGNKMRLKKRIGGVETVLTTLDYSTIGVLYPGVWYGLRVQAATEGSATRIKVYLDSVELINMLDSTLLTGAVGMYRAIGASGVAFDEVEMFRLPLDTETIEINP